MQHSVPHNGFKLFIKYPVKIKMESLKIGLYLKNGLI